jgi:hypothetical protein
MFKQYRRKEIAELRPYVSGECMDGISVGAADVAAGSPKTGDMIARNPANHAEQWLVAAAYLADNFEPVDAACADAQLGRRHTAVARRVVSGLPRDALVNRATSLEGLAVYEVPSTGSLAARGDSSRGRAGRRFRACRSSCIGPRCRSAVPAGGHRAG